MYMYLSVCVRACMANIVERLPFQFKSFTLVHEWLTSFFHVSAYIFLAILYCNLSQHIFLHMHIYICVCFYVCVCVCGPEE